MITVDLEEYKPGMILAESVYSRQDVLLLKEGSELTERKVWILKSWGISKVSVAGEQIEDINPGKRKESKAMETIKKELKEKFSDVLEDPVMEKIMNVACKQIEKDIS
ncbi:MAG: hypothetical protein B6I30_01770 [Desulfobacteraceae bacterium 4572_187]|nr:MAG: hypothetical protein B6I30_01770 [Desulfobacteraceae bacterium 4572_187]